MSRMSLSIVLPAFNEIESLPDTLLQCDAVAHATPELIEVIVVDDGSSDTSTEFLHGAQMTRPWLRVLRHESNRGYGAALKSGFLAARGALVFYTDSDNQFDLLEIRDALSLMDQADMVIGFRVYRFDPLARLIISWFYNRFVRLLFRVRVRDVDCSFKLMRRVKLDQLTLLSDDFFIDTELVARARKWNWRIVEMGVRHYPRRSGRTTVRPGDIPRTLRVVGRMWREIHFPSRFGQQQRSAVDAQLRLSLRRPLEGEIEDVAPWPHP
jgi:dolichol-phosphate mannosyltransferase